MKKYLKVSKAQSGWLSHLYKCLTSVTKRKVQYLEWAIAFIKSSRKSTVTVALQPCGVVRFPQSLAEVLSALQCVLTCLVDLHALGWTHLDLLVDGGFRGGGPVVSHQCRICPPHWGPDAQGPRAPRSWRSGG